MARDAAARSPFTHSRSLMTRKPEGVGVGVGWAGVKRKAERLWLRAKETWTY